MGVAGTTGAKVQAMPSFYLEHRSAWRLLAILFCFLQISDLAVSQTTPPASGTKSIALAVQHYPPSNPALHQRIISIASGVLLNLLRTMPTSSSQDSFLTHEQRNPTTIPDFLPRGPHIFILHSRHLSHHSLLTSRQSMSTGAIPCQSCTSKKNTRQLLHTATFIHRT